MLILTRRINESIVLNNDTKILITGIKGNQVKIGIEAPKDVVVVREELINNEPESQCGFGISDNQ